MTALTPVVPTPSGAAVTPTQMTATDTIPVQAGGRYLLITRNTTATPLVTTIDDPNSAGPAGAQSFNPDVQVTTPITTGVRSTILDSNRFRDGSGNINLTSTGTAAGTTAEVYGPL
jgi:hypothetical protein